VVFSCLFLTNLLPEIVMAEHRLLIQTKVIPLLVSHSRWH